MVRASRRRADSPSHVFAADERSIEGHSTKIGVGGVQKTAYRDGAQTAATPRMDSFILT
jgi:hypothetical protein